MATHPAPDPAAEPWADTAVTGSGGGTVWLRDYGGTGHPTILIHGAGADRTAWDAVGPLLAAGYRTVAVDMPGHGQSSGPWSWAGALDAVDTAVSALAWQRPAVVGHSVGGLVAGRWARRHPQCRCTVSLDGHRVTGARADHHDGTAAGLDTGDLAEAMRRYRTWFDALFATYESTLNPAQRAGSAAARTAMAADDLASFRGVGVPLLLVVADRSGPGTPAAFEPLLTAFRAGLRRDLGALSAEQPTTTVQRIDAHHGMIAEVPGEVAGIVGTFIASAV